MALPLDEHEQRLFDQIERGLGADEGLIRSLKRRVWKRCRSRISALELRFFRQFNWWKTRPRWQRFAIRATILVVFTLMVAVVGGWFITHVYPHLPLLPLFRDRLAGSAAATSTHL